MWYFFLADITLLTLGSPQLGAEVEALKETIAGLKTSVQTAKEKQKAAKDECKKLEKDMDEFKNNKDGKIDELKVGIPLSFFCPCR